MKIFAIINFLAVVCVAAASGMDPGSAMNAVQSSIGKVSYVAHRHIVKRQSLTDLTTQDIARCSSALIEHQCSSGFAQGVIDIALSCRNMTAARVASTTCARSAGGQFCGVATVDLSADQTQATNAATCSGAVTRRSCPSACRSFLQTARSRLGCCVNTYVNTTDSPVYFAYRELVDYRLWNLCNVDLPASDCGNALPLNPPSNAQTCTFSEYFRRSINYECMASVGQPLVDALVLTSRCYPIAVLAADACGTNANGDFCAAVIGEDVFGSGSANPILADLGSCGVSTSTCTSSCRNTVSNVRNTFGCCVNIYNNSNLLGVEIPSLSYSYWNSCGVDTPGFCTSTLNSATAMKGFAWLIVAAMALVYVVYS